MAAYLPLEVQRNGQESWTFQFLDTEKRPLDLTGATFDMGIRYAAGDNAGRLASAAVEMVDAVQGLVGVTINGATLDSLPGRMELVLLAYDLIVIQGGMRMPMLRGPLALTPGVS